jgi:DNA excision repair protein ERCC-1
MIYKAFEHKPPDMLKERVQKDYPSQLQNALTSVKGVNKTDVITLSTNFGVSTRAADSRFVCIEYLVGNRYILVMHPPRHSRSRS